jgi:hypothetical protein
MGDFRNGGLRGFFGGIRGIASVTFFRKFKLPHTRQGDTEFSVDSMH